MNYYKFILSYFFCKKLRTHTHTHTQKSKILKKIKKKRKETKSLCFYVRTEIGLNKLVSALFPAKFQVTKNPQIIKRNGHSFSLPRSRASG